MAVKLPRLPTNWEKQPQLLERYWDQAMTNIENILTQILEIPIIKEALEQTQLDVIEAKASADDAQLTADNATSAAAAAAAAASGAQGSADNAQIAAQAITEEQSLVNSYITGWTGALISSTALGSITVAAHTRVYGNGTSVPVMGGTFSTPATTDQLVRVYYNDPSRTGGVVAYQYTIDPSAPPVQTGDTHSVGAVTVPPAGVRDGTSVKGPGFITEVPT